MRYLRFMVALPLLFYGLSSFALDEKLELHLPWEYGHAYRCTQKNHDTPTHQKWVRQTQYDLDFGLPVGTPLYASADGIFFGYNSTNPNEYFYSGFGWHVKVDHGDYYSLYAHLSAVANITDGTHIEAGDLIGWSGGDPSDPHRGISFGAHIHFGLHEGAANKAKFGSSVESTIISRLSGQQAVFRPSFDFGRKDNTVCNGGGVGTFYYSHNPAGYNGQSFEDIICEEHPKCQFDSVGGTGGGALPDFAFTQVWLEDAATGLDIVNAVRPNQQLKVRCRHINDGADSPVDIEVKALLSNGENVDSNPTTVATDDIQKSNLDHNEKHTESMVFNAPSENGVYNVTCDTDTDNDVVEEHESNNEYDDGYVFEVDDLSRLIPVTHLIINQ